MDEGGINARKYSREKCDFRRNCEFKKGVAALKISEVVKELEKVKEEYGDLTVVLGIDRDSNYMSSKKAHLVKVEDNKVMIAVEPEEYKRVSMKWNRLRG